MGSPRPKMLEAGLFLLLVALPLGFLPFTASPFGDVKLVFLLAGSLALWIGAPQSDRRLRLAAGAWVLVTAASALFGVDRAVGLTASTSGEGNGLMVVLASAAVLVAGPGIDDELLERARRWTIWVCGIVAACGIAFRFVPGLFNHVAGNGAFEGATLGNHLFAATFLVIGIGAALGGSSIRPRDLVVVGFITLGVAAFGERSSLVLPPLVCLVMVWRARPPTARAIGAFLVVVGVLVLWQVCQPLFPATPEQSAVGQFGSHATDSERFIVWRVLSGAALERPVLGWGPGTSQSAYLHAASAADIARTTRIWADAHNLFLETLTGSGVLGLLALLWVVAVVVPCAWRPRRGREWTLAAAVALSAYALFEPVGIVLTPLLFLFAGMAAGPREGEPAREGRLLRWTGAGLLATALAVSGLMLVAATLQHWGDAESEPWAYRASLDLVPWRTSVSDALALRLAVDGRSSDPAIAKPAAAEARAVIADAVAAHPWDPNVRPTAANVETLLKDPSAAANWVRQQVARFPSDTPPAAPSAGAAG